MRALIVSFVLSVALLQVCAGAAYDAKQDALLIIDARFKDVTNLKNTLLTTISNERKSVGVTGEKELENHLIRKANDTRKEFEIEVSAVIRTAIVKAKPISVIYCIRSVSFNGSDIINKAFQDFRIQVLQIKNKKLDKLSFDELTVNSIFGGLSELVAQAKNKLNQPSAEIEVIRKQALKNCESANLLLGELECCLQEPILAKEYAKMRQQIEREFATVQVNLKESLDRCVA